MKYFCLATIWLVFGGQAFAQILPPIPRWNDPRVVFITNPDGRGVGCTCGGIIDIAGRSHVLTVAHDTNGPRAVVNVHLQDGRRVRGTNVAYDRKADCSIFKLDTPCKASFTVAASRPALPIRSRMRGFPHSRAYRDRVGLLRTRYTTAWSAQGAAIQGESGGPVTDENDQIVGVISATDNHSETVVSPWPPIRRMVDEVESGYGKVVTDTQCYGGQCYGGGGGPMYYAQPPGYRPPQQRPPQQWNQQVVSQPPPNPLPAIQPATPACPCGPKWDELNKQTDRILVAFEKQSALNIEIREALKVQGEINAEFRSSVSQQNTAIANIKNDVANTINQKFETYAQDHPAPVVPDREEIKNDIKNDMLVIINQKFEELKQQTPATGGAAPAPAYWDIKPHN